MEALVTDCPDGRASALWRSFLTRIVFISSD